MPRPGRGGSTTPSVAGHLLVEIRSLTEAEPSRPRFDDCPYLTVNLSGGARACTAVHGPSPGVDGSALATEVEWNDRIRLPVAKDTTPNSLGSLAANLHICAYAAPPGGSWSPEGPQDLLLRDSKLAEQVGNALFDLKDILHPQRAKRHSADHFWTHPQRVELKQATRVGSPSARRGAPLADERPSGDRRGARRSDHFFYNSGGGWDSTTTVDSPPGPRPGRSPMTEQVAVTGYVEVALKFEPATNSSPRGRSPRLQTSAPLDPGDDKGAALLKRLEGLSHTPEMQHLKRGLQANSSRGFGGPDHRQSFREFCSRGVAAGRDELNCDQFLRICRKGAKMKIIKGSQREKEICAFFFALDLDGDELVTIDQLIAFVWDEPPPLPPGFEPLDISLWGDFDDEFEHDDASASSTSVRRRAWSGSSMAESSRGSLSSFSRGSLSRFDGYSSDSDDVHSLTPSSRSSNFSSRSRSAQHGSPTIAALRKELKAEGLPVTGSEFDMKKRLLTHRKEQEQMEERRSGWSQAGGRSGMENGGGGGGRSASPRSSATRRSPRRSPQRSPRRTPRGRSPSRRRSPSRSRSRSPGISLHEAHTKSSERKARHGEKRALRSRRSRSKSPTVAAAATAERRRRQRSPSATSNRDGRSEMSGATDGGGGGGSSRDRYSSGSSSPWNSSSLHGRRHDDGYGQASRTRSTRSAESSSKGNPWDSDSEDDVEQTAQDHRVVEQTDTRRRVASRRVAGQADARRHREQRHWRNLSDEDEDSPDDDAEREHFSRGAEPFTTRISGGVDVVDKGRRRDSRLASSEGTATDRVQRLNVVDLSLDQPRTTLVDQPRTSKRRDGYASPPRRAHSPHHKAQIFVTTRHPGGSRAMVHGDDRLLLRRANPDMRDKAYAESRDSPIALHTRDAADTTAAAPTSARSGGGGGGGGAEPASKLHTAFSA